MNLYSHAVLANRLCPILQPDNYDDYIWGSIAPDIRYLTGMRRDHTHLPEATLAAWTIRYPCCKSFIQGYRVHCLLDQIDTVQALTRSFPLRPMRFVFRKILTPRRLAVAIELYYHRAFPQGLRLSGSQNEVLAGLGISAGHVETYIGALRSYLKTPSFDSAAAAFTQLGIIEDKRIEKYAAEYRKLQDNRFVLALLHHSIQRAAFEKVAADLLRFQNRRPV